MPLEPNEVQYPPVTSLSPSQRRVLGTMIEKGLTVPESYPMTLKSLTTGCNQKSARHPITNYSEDDVEETLQKLREMGLAAVVHTESGRTERFRHYVRKRFSELSEPQVAIFAELLLRGRQSMGDLRSRAVRMAPNGSLDTLDQLRAELTKMLSLKLIQADAPLDRRGVEIDHNLYEAREGKTLAQRTHFDDEPATDQAAESFMAAPRGAAVSSPPANTAAAVDWGGRIAAIESHCGRLDDENRQLQDQVAALRRDLNELRQALGS